MIFPSLGAVTPPLSSQKDPLAPKTPPTAGYLEEKSSGGLAFASLSRRTLEDFHENSLS